MKRMLKHGLAGLVLVLAVIGLSGCDFLTAVADALASFDGRVVNVGADSTQTTDLFKGENGATLVGATITFDNLTDAAVANKTITIGADGKFLINLENGEYKITGAKDGWAFVPVFYTVSGFAGTLPDIMAYEYNASGTVFAGPTDIIILLSWKDESFDLDSYAVFDADKNNLLYTKTAEVYYGDKDHLGITLERDVRDADAASNPTPAGVPRVETIRVRADAAYATGDQIRFYVKNYDPALPAGVSGSITGSTIDNDTQPYALVNVMQGDVHYGLFPLPRETLEDTVGVVKLEKVSAGWNISSFGPNAILNVLP